jgi:hypothetical protein
MPAITLTIEAGGPIINAMVGVSQPRHQALVAAGQTPPNGIMGRFLIDTGASNTCVDPELIAPLALPQIGIVAISTPSTDGNHHFCEQFDACFFIPGAVTNGVGHYIPAIPLMATHLRSQGFDGLIGRDILATCTLTYIGSAGLISLSY